MTEVLTFLIGSLSLLATPGPTNTLLATAGAVSGFRRSAVLLAGELAGYLTAIAVLILVVGPVIAAVPAFGIVLRVVVCAYILYLAWTFWHRSAACAETQERVSLPSVFVTTLLNPKAVIFAFTLLPNSTEGLVAMAPWLAALSALIVVVGATWIALGASIRRGSGKGSGATITYRVASIALMLIVGMISWNTVAAAFG